jgi:Ser/Thr protein kinase RdoA (MazF antagonist)
MEPLLQKIAEKYDLRLRLVEKVAQGYLSENHVLTNGDSKYFLKKYRFANSERIAEIHCAKKYFSDGGIPVILPIVNEDSETFFEHEKGFYALFPFVYDQQIAWDKLDKKAITSYAEMLARIHLIGSKSTISVSESNTPWDSKATLQKIEQILKIISGIEHKTEFDIRTEKNLLLKKTLIKSNQKTYDQFNFHNDHLIHGDYIVPNVFFDDNKNVSYVFDWEKTKYSSRFLELFSSLIQCTLFETVRSKWYLDAYLTLYPASKEDLENGLDAYCLEHTHSLWIEEEHYLKGNNRTDELLDSNSRKIAYFANDLNEFKKIIFEQ